MQAYVDLAICTYAQVLQNLHEMRLTSPGIEAGSKFYKIMEDCMTFRARPDIVPYIAPGAPCDRLQPPSLPACQSDKTDGIQPTSLTSPTHSCAATHKLEFITHHLTQALYATTRAAIATSPAGVVVFPFDPGERVTYLTGGIRSSFSFDPGG